MDREHIDLPGKTLRPGMTRWPFSDAVRVGDTLYLAGRIGIDPATGKPPNDIADEARVLMDDVFARIDAQRVRDALAQLPPEQRGLIEQGFFGGVTHQELARRTDTPLGTVKTRIRNGLRRMRESLGERVS